MITSSVDRHVACGALVDRWREIFPPRNCTDRTGHWWPSPWVLLWWEGGVVGLAFGLDAFSA